MLAPARLSLVFASLALACGAERPALPPLPPVEGRVASPEEARALLDVLGERDDAIRSYRSVHVLEIEDRRDDRRANLRGVLLVRRPDRFRLRLVHAMGVTAMDVVRVGVRCRIDLPGRGPVDCGEPGVQRRLPVKALEQVFLRRFDGEATELRIGRAARRLVLRRPDGGRRVILVSPTAAEARVDSFGTTEREELRVTYEDHRVVGDHRLPFRIRLDVPERDLVVRVTVERYDLDPDIAPEAFEIR